MHDGSRHVSSSSSSSSGGGAVVEARGGGGARWWWRLEAAASSKQQAAAAAGEQESRDLDIQCCENVRGDHRCRVGLKHHAQRVELGGIQHCADGWVLQSKFDQVLHSCVCSIVRCREFEDSSLLPFRRGGVAELLLGVLCKARRRWPSSVGHSEGRDRWRRTHALPDPSAASRGWHPG